MVQDNTSHAVLRQLIQTEGLLDRSPAYYLFQVLFLTMFGVMLGGFFVYFPPTPLSAVLLALLSAFLSVQIGFLGHDISHRQVFRSAKLTKLAEIFHWNFLLGLSAGWWHDQHNTHHFYSNESELDPTINFRIFSFSPKQFLSRTGYQKMAIRYQAWLFFPLTTLMSSHMTVSGFTYLLTNKVSCRIPELASILAHMLIYGLIVFSTFEVQNGIIFIIAHYIFMGFYMGITFAPNHKGMPIIDKDDPLFSDFLRRQVVTSRNIPGNFLVTFFYGGLNYQIEHHLFPAMPRRNFRKASSIVKPFCLSRGVLYHETGIWQSYKEIIGYLQKQSCSST